ncbi:MAG: endonuclease domain-containing protein [Actinomycetia bacterium]|nr:endonuclease domain-containing protein [Actinomycetes bacterium]
MKRNLIKRARDLRKNSTDAESLLWKHISRKQLEGIKFRRQHPIENYIVDFICFEKKIVIEVDGGQHNIDNKKDIIRDNFFNGKGYKVLRFWNNEVLKNIEGVIGVIREECVKTPSPKIPSRQGRGK